MGKQINGLIKKKERVWENICLLIALVVVGIIIAVFFGNADLKSLLSGVIGSLVGGVVAYLIALDTVINTAKIDKAEKIPDKIDKMRSILVKLNVVLLQFDIYVRSSLAYKVNKRSGESIANSLINLSDSIRSIGIQVNKDVDSKVIEFLDGAIRNNYFHFISIPSSPEGEEELLTEEEFAYLFNLDKDLRELITYLEEILKEYEEEYRINNI
ncbi:hypothetical protein P4310_17225 [Bacillus thuringiensis]|uniref:hypothetical protein n=1 Tax=Bacillus cereus group TaxID=86661 RepID=UPI000A3C3FEF|nr:MULTISPECIES: hypothetical protein [Bacillus cereus group]MCX9102839.1 hypothetical protein [Bacillus anthracis]MED3067280.1 hypothetical protein [Bacillus thuringiensis]OUB38241.1 hypothetical protein BK737_00240 [Bacillus thuringiensis serovar palmanyolensis]